ncbi:hypothetical protein [Candidatus Electronema sp. TJ]|uniref:hypothetical protein n=1 Tax=Candidatus Electronema sp. TJ TaxID=3401573 RepID=UPI003AA93184
MLTNSIPKLLQEAREVRQALAAIGAGLPEEISAAGMDARIAELEAVGGELDALNVDRTRLVNLKREKAEAASDYIVQARAAVKGIFGADSSEYDMMGGTRTSERSRTKKKEGGTA